MISIVQLGTVDYATALRLQQSLVEMRKTGQIGDTLLLLEHSPVITLGRNAKRQHLLASPGLLEQEGVEVFECDRGGDVTFHGPGQLVGYPIFDLREFQPKIGAVEFVRRMEQVLIRTCADFGVATQPLPKLTGVWTSDGARPAKIAAIGVHISRGVTSHGFALNVNTDLRYFDLIVPCGISSRPVTSMRKELKQALPLGDVAKSVGRYFGEIFASDIQWTSTLDALFGRTVGIPLKIPEELRKLHAEQDVFLA